MTATVATEPGAEQDLVTTEPEPSLRPRVLAAAGALVLGAATGAFVLATMQPESPRAHAVAAWFVAVGLGLLVVGVAARRVVAVGVASAGLGVAYAAGHLHPATVVPSPVLVLAPALVTVAELAAWSIDLSPAAVDEPSVFVDRLRWLGLAVGGSVLVAVVLDGAAHLRMASGLPLDALSVAAVLGSLAVVAGLARRPPPQG